jgi:hypothetical protein
MIAVDELRAYVGAHAPRGPVHRERRGAHNVTAWLAPLESHADAPLGWWWAITQPCGDHEVVVGMGWAIGRRVADRNADIARRLSALVAGMAVA